MSSMKHPPFSFLVDMTPTSATGTYGPAPGEPTLLASGACTRLLGSPCAVSVDLPAAELAPSGKLSLSSSGGGVEVQPCSILCCPCRKCVQEWEEPHDSALYCIRSDKNHMIASGSSYYGVVRLWDKRQTRCLQVRAGQRLGSSRAFELFSSRPVPMSLWNKREGLLYCLWGEPTMETLTYMQGKACFAQASWPLCL